LILSSDFENRDVVKRAGRIAKYLLIGVAAVIGLALVYAVTEAAEQVPAEAA
jgi:hypothetical protein